MTAALPPSSRVNRLRGACALRRQPTSVEPVNDTCGTRSSTTRAGQLVRHRQHRKHRGGQVRLRYELAQKQRAQWRRRRGFDDYRAAGRERGCQLVGDQVHRKVERGDRQDRAGWEPPDDPQPLAQRRIGVEAQHLTVEPPGLLGRPPEGQHRSVRLRGGPLPRLATLANDQIGDLVPALGEALGDVAQSGGAGGARQVRAVPPGGLGSGQGFLDVGRPGHTHPRDRPAVVGVGHRQGLCPPSPLAGQDEGDRVRHRCCSPIVRTRPARPGRVQ